MKHILFLFILSTQIWSQQIIVVYTSALINIQKPELRKQEYIRSLNQLKSFGLRT